MLTKGVCKNTSFLWLNASVEFYVLSIPKDLRIVPSVSLKKFYGEVYCFHFEFQPFNHCTFSKKEELNLMWLHKSQNKDLYLIKSYTIARYFRQMHVICHFNSSSALAKFWKNEEGKSSEKSVWKVILKETMLCVFPEHVWINNMIYCCY